MKVNEEGAQVILDAFREVHYSAVDHTLFDQVKDYKERIASKFRAIGKDEIPRIKGREFYISLKLDGEHAELYYEDGRACLVRPRGYAYLGLPLLDDAVKILKQAGVGRAMFPGELYVKRADGERTRVFDVVSLTKSPKSAEDLALLHFAPFDIIFLDDEVFVDYADVLARLRGLFGDTPLEPPPTVISQSQDEIRACYDRWVNREGAEGLMIRSDLTFRYKLKAQHTVDAVIIGYTHENEIVTSVLTALVTEDGLLQVLTKVEKGLNDVERMDLFQKLSRQQVTSDFLEVSRYHTPFIMVRPKHIIEFSTNDMVAETTSGKIIKKAALRLKKDHYTLVKSTPFVSLKHCIFVRFRDDKQVNPVDLRVSQITDAVFLDLADESSKPIEFPETEVLIRDVYIKKTKDKIAIRKILVWRTHKETIDSSFATYVLNYTDYSAGRKAPLQQEVRISNSREQIIELAAEFKEKNIKKGWSHINEH